MAHPRKADQTSRLAAMIVSPDNQVLASVSAGLTGARGRSLGHGEQLVEVAAQNPHAPPDDLM